MTESIRALDTWAHPFTDETAEIWAKQPEFMHAARMFKNEHMLEVRIEQMLEEMEASGTERAGISAMDTPYVQIRNDWVAEMVRNYPDRFWGCASADPRNGMAAVRELERAVGDLGLKGLSLQPFAYRTPPNANIYYPLYAQCVELDVPVRIQVGHTAPLLPSEPGRPIYLDEVALHFPELKIIGAHIGWPWHDEMISLAWKHPNVYMDTSAHLPKHYPPTVVQFLNSFGQDKVMYGSAYPLTSMRRQMKELDEIPLDDTVRRKLLRENATRVWNLWPGAQ